MKVTTKHQLNQLTAALREQLIRDYTQAPKSNKTKEYLARAGGEDSFAALLSRLPFETDDCWPLPNSGLILQDLLSRHGIACDGAQLLEGVIIQVACEMSDDVASVTPDAPGLSVSDFDNRPESEPLSRTAFQREAYALIPDESYMLPTSLSYHVFSVTDEGDLVCEPKHDLSKETLCFGFKSDHELNVLYADIDLALEKASGNISAEELAYIREFDEVQRWIKSDKCYEAYLQCHERATGGPCTAFTGVWLDSIEEALLALYVNGGSMVLDGWEWWVGDEPESVFGDIDAYQATKRAMREGGLSERQIAEWLKDWQF